MIDIERTFEVAGIHQIDLRIAQGDLTLTAGGDRIALRASLRSDDEAALETTVLDGVLLIKNRAEAGWLGRNSSRIDVALTVPRAAALAVNATTGLGDVHARGVAGVQEITTGKGDVRAEGGEGRLAVKTGKGDIVVRAWRGDLDATTGKGDAAIDGLSGGLQLTSGAGDAAVERWQAGGNGAHQVKTGSGDVRISDAQASRLTVTTGRGDCTLRKVALDALVGQTGLGSFSVEGDPRQGTWQVRTGKGDITLALAAGAAARVEAATRHGSIQSSLPQVKVARPGPASPHGGRTIMVVGEEPRAEIRLETIKGDIAIRAAGAAEPPLSIEVSRETLAAGRAQLPGAEAPAVPSAGPTSALAILESLARGEISVDEAEMLLRSLG